ncbi:solute carrier family 2, facilitated glucose transporter member 5-like [Tiliqua scincoides]|uniref:solute carrier family 2, facilitated glucose transporter member 5-like n=1 Tax=Tiliqua scincoides TaxID=71010 RepID=UPI003462CCA6
MHAGLLVLDPAQQKLKQYLSNLSIQVVDKERQDEEIHPSLLIFTVAAFLLGCVFGSVLIGPLADKCGSDRLVSVGQVRWHSSGAVVSKQRLEDGHQHCAVHIADNHFAAAESCIFSSAVPLFLGEISPTNLRGGIATLPWLAISVGMVMSQLLGGPEVLGTKKGLPFLQSIPAIIAFFQFFLLLLFPESPRYLLIQRRDEEGARQALQKLRGQDDVEDEIEELRQEDLYEQEEKEMTILKLLCSPHLRWQLICVITLFMTQQFSGITAAYYYAEKVFRSMKVEKNNLRYSSALLTFCSLFGHGLSDKMCCEDNSRVHHPEPFGGTAK